MADTDSVLELALGDFLAGCEAGLTTAGYPIPARSGEPGVTHWGITHAAPVIDWEQAECPDVLAVWLDRIEARPLGERRHGAPGESQESGWHAVAMLRVQLWSFFPDLTDSGNPPSAAATTAATLKLARGAWAIWCEIGRARDADELFPSIENPSIRRSDIGIGSMTPQSPNGYTAGWQLNVEVLLPSVLSGQPPGS